MDIYVCFCGNEVNVNNNAHMWKLMPYDVVDDLKSKLNDLEVDGADYYYDMCYFGTSPIKEAFLCPHCNGIDIDESDGDKVFLSYYIPEKHYASYLLIQAHELNNFSCTCGKTVNTNNLQNQWIMINFEERSLDNLGKVFEDRGSVEEFYRQLYSVNRRAITCPYCSGMTVVECDSEGMGIKADYYSRKGERRGEEDDL